MKDLLTKLISWAKRDNVCAAALFLGVVGSFPHALDALARFIQTIVPIAQAISGGK